MKSLSQYINESLAIERLKKEWDDKLIPFDTMIDFAKQALKKSKTSPRAICAELGSYEDPDDLWNAYDRGELSELSNWEDTFTDMLADTDEWGGKEGDIADALFDLLYDTMDQIDRKKL